MAQTKTIQLLRSSQAYTNIEAAKTALLGRTGQKDGEILLARYWATEGNTSVVKSLLGIYHSAPDLSGTGITEGTTKGWTFIQDQSSIDSILDGLDANINYTTGESGASDSATDDSLIVVGVKQANGQVSALTSELGSVKVSSVTATSATSKIAAEQTLSENLGRLQGQINDMDLTARTNATTDGQVVVTISQVDGKVSETVTNLSDVKMTGYAPSSSNTGTISANDTLEEALNKVENAIAANKVTAGDASITMGTDATDGNDTVAVNIKSGEHVLALSSTSGAEGLYTDLDLVKITTNLPTNVKERYQLLATDDTQIGTNIDIYKDSALQSVKLLHADLTANPQLKPTYSNGTWTDIASASQTEENLALCYAYLDVNGDTVVEAVPVGDFLRESEFGDGLQVVSGVVSVKVDPLSQSVTVSDGNGGSTTVPVLSVSSNGVKVDNIQEAINYAVANASTTLAVSAQGDNYITAAVDANNNKKINVTADVQALTATAGTAGTYDSDGAQTVAPVAGTLSGVADSLADSSDIATKVKTYVDGAIAIEAARSDAKNLADLKTVVEGLDGTATASSATNVDSTPTADFKVLTKVAEVDGKVVETTVANGSTAVTLKKLAATGAAADVSIADSGNLITETTVEGALQEIATNVRNNALVSNDVIVVTPDTANNNTKLSVTIGNGLEKTGTNGNTLAVKQGDGVTVDANGVSVNAGDGLVIDNSGNVNVNTGDGLEIASDAVKIKLDTTTTTANITSDMLSISSNGLMMKDTWDCGTF